MHNLEICREALEDELVFLVVDAELFRLPVDVPGAHGTVAPRLLVLHCVEVDEDQPIVGNAKQLLIARQRYTVTLLAKATPGGIFHSHIACTVYVLGEHGKIPTSCRSHLTIEHD